MKGNAVIITKLRVGLGTFLLGNQSQFIHPPSYCPRRLSQLESEVKNGSNEIKKSSTRDRFKICTRINFRRAETKRRFTFRMDLPMPTEILILDTPSTKFLKISPTVGRLSMVANRAVIISCQRQVKRIFQASAYFIVQAGTATAFPLSSR